MHARVGPGYHVKMCENCTRALCRHRERHQQCSVKGPFKCYVMQMGVGGCLIFWEKKRYEGVMFNVISVTRGWVGVQFPEK